MNDFIEKWKTDSRFKTKVKLGLYTLFVVIVSIYAFANRAPFPENALNTENKKDEVKINIPDKYNYELELTINENEYKYTGTKDDDTETIKKIIDDEIYNYIYKDNKYYKESIEEENIVDKEEIYDMIDPVYINLENINKYLSLSHIEDGKNIVYLKDIIIGGDSEEYIIITVIENTINIDYTSLMKVFDKTIENFNIEVIIDEIE